MPKKLSKAIYFVLFLLAAAFFCGCVSSQPPAGAKQEIWKGQFTGDINGDLTITAWNVSTDKNLKVLKGELNSKIDSVIGGYGTGTLYGNLSGQIKDGVFTASFRGNAKVTDGSARVSGRFIGNMSEKKGAGTWNCNVTHGAMRLKGKWTLEKQ